MTNLDSILKSRDITLPTKVCIVRAMVFPVVMYGCESWTIKKTECKRKIKYRSWAPKISWAPKSLQMVTAAMKLKDACSLEEKQTDSILKSRDTTLPTKVV